MSDLDRVGCWYVARLATWASFMWLTIWLTTHDTLHRVGSPLLFLAGYWTRALYDEAGRMQERIAEARERGEWR